MTSLAIKRLSAAEYLALERQATDKSEFVNGEIYAMAGGSREHVLIAGNAAGELRAQLRGRPCETYPMDMRVKVSPTGMYTYPDVVVVCGEPEFEDAEVDTLLNPTIIIEILSRTSEAYDRGDKFAHYRRLASLTDFVMIAQDQPRVEHYARAPNEQWVLTEVSGLDQVLHLPSIGCALSLADLYERVKLPGAAEQPILWFRRSYSRPKLYQEAARMNLRITINPGVCHGQACIRDTRIPVHQIVRMLANGDTMEELIEEYPSLQTEDIQAALEYAATLAEEQVTPIDLAIQSA